MENNKNKIEKEIIERIKNGRIKLRSKYIFLAEKLGLRSTIVLSVLLSILFFNLIFFYLKSTDTLVYLSFGKRGLFAFLESFPYLLVAVFVLLIFLVGFIISKSDLSHRKSFIFIVAFLIFFIIPLGILTAYTTGISERIDRQIYTGRPMGGMFRPFMRGISHERDGGIAGRVIKIEYDAVLLETPFGIKKIDLKRCYVCSSIRFEEGDFLVGIGENKGDIFEVFDVKIADKNDMKMVEKRIDHRFGYWECGPNMPASSSPCGILPEDRDCVRGCIENGLSFEECRLECR